MKNIMIICFYLSFLTFLLLLIGCSILKSPKAPVVPPVGVFTAISSPYSGDLNKSIGFKTGEAQCTCILSLFSFGDCSVDTAARNGNLTMVDYIDYEYTNVLGIISIFRTKAYGSASMPKSQHKVSSAKQED